MFGLYHHNTQYDGEPIGIFAAERGHLSILKKNANSMLVVLVGLAAYYAWARTKHFGCHSVILSVCYPGMPL